MNSLIILYNKYHSNDKKDNNLINNSSNLMDLEINNDIHRNSDKNNMLNESYKKINIGKSNENKNINIFNYNNNNEYSDNIINKNINTILNNVKKNNNESFFHNFKKPCRRSYLDLLSQNIYKKNKENNKNTIINLNINNNNYYYINNNKYTIDSEEKYCIDFSKKKTLKKY